MRRLLVLVLLIVVACEQTSPTRPPTETPAPITATPLTHVPDTTGSAQPTPRSGAAATPTSLPTSSVTITPDMVSWLQQHAIPLRTTIPDSPLDDLQPLGTLTGNNVRIVGVGESA